MSAATSSCFPVFFNTNRSLPSNQYSYWCYRCNRYVRIRIVAGELECTDCGFAWLMQFYSRSGSSTGSTDYSYNYWCYRCRRYSRIRIVIGGDSPGLKCSDCGDGRLLQFCHRRSTAPLITVLSDGGYTLKMEQRNDDQPSSAASLRTIEINDYHVAEESHCTVCTEAFELGTKVSETPCKHIYHSPCILQWIEYGKDSCPLCRNKLQPDVSPNKPVSSTGGSNRVRRFCRGLFSCFNGL